MITLQEDLSINLSNRYTIDIIEDIEESTLRMVHNKLSEIHRSYSKTGSFLLANNMAENRNNIPGPNVDLNISSYGGSVYAGLGIYDLLNGKINRSFGAGYLMSMGFVLFLAGERRIITPNTSLMMHSVTGFTWNKVPLAEIDMKELKRIQNIMISIIQERTKIPDKYYTEAFINGKDVYITPKQALKWGIVHEITS